MTQWLSCLVVAATVVLATTGSTDRTPADRATIVGLDAGEVEKRIGVPDERNELADSDEVYWIYKTKAGTLSIHFQNAVVVDIDPADFPLEKILKSIKPSEAKAVTEGIRGERSETH
jgi:hypothetical protein